MSNGRPSTPSAARTSADAVLEESARLRALGEPHVLATVVWRRRPTSGKPGARALVRADGSLTGWVGGVCSGPAVSREALRALRKGLPRLLCLGSAEDFPTAGEGRFVQPIGCASEGALEVFLEPQLPTPRLLGIGSAPVLACLEAMAGALGFEAGTIDPHSGDSLDLGGLGPGSIVVVASMGQCDEDALEAALASPAGYVALVASSKRAAAVVEELRKRGVPENALARLRAPAGLDLGPIRHEEIAVAILAEVVQLRAEGSLGTGLEEGAGAPAAAPRAEPAEALDPICGMTVEVAKARFRTEHAGTTYYFCCAGCQRKFEADPAAHVLKGAAP